MKAYKICTKCKINKEFKEYYTNRNTLESRCKVCSREDGRQYRIINREALKARRNLRKEEFNEKTKAWYAVPENRVHALEYLHKYRIGREAEFNKKSRDYYEKNKEALKKKRDCPIKKAKAILRTRQWMANKKSKEQKKKGDQ